MKMGCNSASCMEIRREGSKWVKRSKRTRALSPPRAYRRERALTMVGWTPAGGVGGQFKILIEGVRWIDDNKQTGIIIERWG